MGSSELFRGPCQVPKILETLQQHSYRYLESPLAGWGAEESVGRILHPLPAKVSLQGATSQPDKAFCKDRVIKKDQHEGLEC